MPTGNARPQGLGAVCRIPTVKPAPFPDNRLAVVALIGQLPLP
jgi:hypothetical protein